MSENSVKKDLSTTLLHNYDVGQIKAAGLELNSLGRRIKHTVDNGSPPRKLFYFLMTDTVIDKSTFSKGIQWMEEQNTFLFFC